jgi:peptide chain release factor 1
VLDRLDSLEREFAEVEARLGDPAVLSDQRRLAAMARRHKELEAVVTCAQSMRRAQGDLAAAREMYTYADAEERDSLRIEINELEVDIARLDADLKLLMLPRDPNDDKNVIVEIRGAEGGEEANLFARDLFDMYRSYATRMGWKFELIEGSESDLGGYASVTFLLKGDSVWSRMKHEGGPHRVQRVPVTEAQGRIHTSSATVSVLPEAEEVDIAIDDRDLQIDVYRSSGPGGQSVNTTDSAVRVTHKPTGLVVAMQDEKSQLQNKEKALRVLRSRLLHLEQERQASERSEARRDQIGGGGRSEKVRTYNFKENRRRRARRRRATTAARSIHVNTTLRDVLAEAEARVGRIDARRIVERASGHDGAELTVHLDRPITQREMAFFDRMVERRAAGEPLQYVLGSWGFRTLDLLLDRRVLIPRPETEVVAGLAMAELDRVLGASNGARRTRQGRVVDLGTGSGAIALSIAVERPGTEVWATDVSAAALDIARANLAGLGRPGRRVMLLEGDWFEALPADLLGTIDLVVSNPPYVASSDPLPAEVRDWEPALALVPGPTGLEAYERIVAGAIAWLAPGGALVLEIGETQGAPVTALARAAGFVSVAVHPDLAARDRAVVAVAP